MSPVILPYEYILPHLHLKKSGPRLEGQEAIPTVIFTYLSIANHQPMPLSFSVSVYDDEGNHVSRPAIRAGGGNYAPDLGFPASGSIAGLNSIILALDPTLSAPIYLFGWARIYTSHPVAMNGWVQRILPTEYSRPVPVFPIDSIGTLPTFPQGDGLPPPARSGVVLPPAPPGITLEIPPPLVNPKLLAAGDAERLRITTGAIKRGKTVDFSEQLPRKRWSLFGSRDGR